MSSPRLLLALPTDAVVFECAKRWVPSVESVSADALEAPPWLTIEAALVGNLSRVLPNLKPADLPNVRFVQHVFTGVDEFPVERFPANALIAGNVGAYAPFVAEHAVALVLALAKRLLPAHQQLLEGKLRPVVVSKSLVGARVLIAGFGEIGHEVARRLRPFGVTITASSRTGSPDPEADEVFLLSNLAEQIERANVIINCLPLTPKTQGVFGAREFARFSEGAIFVNVGRAATVDEDAFWAYLTAHPESRIGLDVWWGEDFPSGRILRVDRVAAFPNLLGTPHSAAFTALSRQRALDRAFENLARFFSGESPRYVASREDFLPRSGSP